MLLASEDTITREGLRSLLRQAPDIDIVGEAETLAAVPKRVLECAPDLTLLEISIPKRAHGLRAAADLAQQSPGVRIIVLTNNRDLPYVRSMLACGVSGYLLKNAGTLQLIAALRSAMRGGKTIDPTLGSDLLWAVHGRSDKSIRPKLSRRELEVLKELTLGYTNLQAASALGISVKSVETYRLRLYRKLHLRSRAELVEYAAAHRLIENVGERVSEKS